MVVCALHEALYDVLQGALFGALYGALFVHRGLATAYKYLGRKVNNTMGGLRS